MDQLGARFPAKCVKNEIHNLLTTLRLSTHTAGREAQIHHEVLRSFQRLFEELTYIHELHEFDTGAYLGPFLEVIQSDAIDGLITAAALGAVNKFVSFGLIHPDSLGCMEAINRLAWGVINCRFTSNDNAKDEVVLLKMVNMLIDCLRCEAGDYLSDDCVWHMVRKCFQISRQPRASHLLRSSAEGVLQQMVLTIFGTHKARAKRVRVKSEPTPRVYAPYGFGAMYSVLRFLSFLLAYGRAGPGGSSDFKPRPRPRRQRSRSPSGERPKLQGADRSPDGSLPSSDLGLTDKAVPGTEDLSEESHCLGLTLLNVALESGGDEIAMNDELINVIQDEICKSLLQNSRTDSQFVLSLTLRAIFNLFLHFKRHLKVQLEIFFASVHLKIPSNELASFEQRELALESVLEFCREPELMLELYENYDCDVRSTNLFETLVKFLVTHSFPSDGVNGVKGGFSSLHRLALSGLLSILHSIALRCERHGPHYQGEILSDGMSAGLLSPMNGLASAETALQQKKEQKRRLALAARTFNSEPFKSMAALQGMGLVSNPATPESMAEFLRHTPALDLKLVGEYLGHRKEFNSEVRKAFMTGFNFQELRLVEGLRACLSSFRLPGEAQVIERLIESFAEQYYVAQTPAIDLDSGDAPTDPLKMVRWVPREKLCEDSAEASEGPEDTAAGSRVKMANSDTIFVLSYAIIMLNTDLHNPGVKVKMTAEGFIRNNRGIDNGSSVPEFFLRDVYETIRDDEIRMHGEASPDGEVEVDDFFWAGILQRSETIDVFETTERMLSETPPGSTESDMFKVIMDCAPLPTLSLCYESVQDMSVASQAMTGFQDLSKISAYFNQADAVNGLVRRMCQYFVRTSAAGHLSVRAQVSLRAAQQCVAEHASLFREAEWRAVLEVILQLWACDLLPAHLTELDDFTDTDGKPLESLCDVKPPFEAPPMHEQEGQEAEARGSSLPEKPAAREAGPKGDGFFQTLNRWLDDETKDSDDSDDDGATKHRRYSSGFGPEDIRLLGQPGIGTALGGDTETLPVRSSDPALIHQQVKLYVARSGFVELFTSTGLSRLSSESMQILAKALVFLSRPGKWSSAGASPGSAGSNSAVNLVSDAAPSPAAAADRQRAEAEGAQWHEMADPVFGLELLTNMTCMPFGPGQSVSHIWPLVSTHFERLLHFVIGGGGSSEHQFIERLIVNTVRLCIRLIGSADLVQTLLSLLQQLSKLPPDLFEKYSERVACGLLVLVKETNLPHSGISVIFALLRRTAEFPSNTGACTAGIEVLNYWLGDDQELSRLLALKQFPELLATLKAFAIQNSTPASTTALDHLSSLVPQLARGARCLPEALGPWQSLWVPTLHALSYVALEGAQKSSAQAFVYLQRLLLERGTEISLPWEKLSFSEWKECLEQVLFPLLEAQPPSDGAEHSAVAERSSARQVTAAKLLCQIMLTHMPDWVATSPEGFSVLFQQFVHVLIHQASVSEDAREMLQQSLKNLLLVISADPTFGELASPQPGETLLEASWKVVTPAFPDLRNEIAVILNPMGEPSEPAEERESKVSSGKEPHEPEKQEEPAPPDAGS